MGNLWKHAIEKDRNYEIPVMISIYILPCEPRII